MRGAIRFRTWPTYPVVPRDRYRCFARGSANAMPGPARCVEGQGRQFYVQSMWTDSMESKWNPKVSPYWSNPLFSG